MPEAEEPLGAHVGDTEKGSSTAFCLLLAVGLFSLNRIRHPLVALHPERHSIENRLLGDAPRGPN